jgi:hypothetical protein
VELVLGESRQDAPFDPDHGSHERVHEHEERELAEVGTYPYLHGGWRRRHAAHHGAGAAHAACPRFQRRMASESAGLGGIPSLIRATNSSRPSERAGFQRFSNPIVVEGLPLIPAPQADPA